MMQNIAIISELIRQQNRGTHDLYSKIPYKLRKHLDGAICNEPWDKVSEGCEQHDQSSLDHAKLMYQFVLDQADEYIKMHISNRHTDTSTEMILDKFSIENEFKNDAARFVLEMAKCLKKEKELIFTYHESGHMDGEISDHFEDITDQVDDIDLKTIEELIQEADNHLYQAIKCMDEEEKYIGLSFKMLETIAEGDLGLNNFITQISAGGSLVEVDQKDTSFDHLRNCAAEYKSLDMSGENVKTKVFNFKQKAVNALNEACIQSSHYVGKLQKDLEAWKIAETWWSVEVGPEPDTGSLINKYKRFGDIINTVMTWFSSTGTLQIIRQKEQSHSPNQVDHFSATVGNLELQFKKIMSIIQIIVVTQPKGVISIENKGKKESPNYCTKKTQPFSTAVRILASECFQNVYVKSTEVELVAEKDLAKKLTVAVTGRNRNSCLDVETIAGNTRPDIQFIIQVKNFSRFEQNNVYKQFFRLRYKLTVSINDIEYYLETMSLPFTFNTGANQILEHKGSRFWYLMSNSDLYNGNFHCLDPLPAEDVICMLDNRVACLGKKARRLTDAEKLFLRERLPVASDGTVTMQGFLKDKMKTLRTDEPLSFSFYTWFYAVIHSIELLLLDAWQDGIIYGFCSDKNAEEMLMVKTVPEGTFLLRPCVSIINKTSSIDATAALVMEVKMRNEDAQPFDNHNSEFCITSVPLHYDFIEENTLFDAIQGIVCNNKPVAKFLYGRNGGRKLDVLKGYVKKPEQKMLPEYCLIIERMKKLKFTKCSRTGSSAVEVSDKEEVESERGPSKRKRRIRNPPSNISSQVPSVLGAMDDSSGGSSSLQVFSDFATEEINQASPPNLQFQSSAAVQCPRSGTQGKKMPGTSDQKTTVSGNMGQRENSLTPTECVQIFGSILVDVSHIPTDIVPSSSFSHFDQVAHTSPETACEGTDFATANSYQNGSTPNLFTAQYHNSVNNNYSGESSRGSPSSVGYNVSVTSSPAPAIESSSQSPSIIWCNSSFSSQCSGESPSQLNAQSSPNLPTILNEACESKRSPRRRGNGRGNNNSNKKKKSPIPNSPETGSQIWNQNMDHHAQVQFYQNDVQPHESFTPDINQISIDISPYALTLEEALSLYNCNENVDESQLTMLLRKQPLCN